MPGVNAEEEVLVKWFLGPWLIGSCLELVLLGVLCCQFVNYYNWYPNDSRSLRIAVAVLCLLSVLKSAETFAPLWVFLIDHFGNIEYDLSLITTGWWDTANPLMVACVDFYVQCFFLYRLWGYAKRWWVVAPIFALLIFEMVAIVLATYFIATSQETGIVDWFGIHLWTAFTGDLILTSTTAYFLIKAKNSTINSVTEGLVTSLIRLTFQTAAPASLAVMFTFIWSQMYRTNNPLLECLEIGFNQPLPKLYAISMMWTLNARLAIRARTEVSGSVSGNYTPSGGWVRSPPRTNVL